MKTLFVIPARGGSKGIPHKNIKPLAGKPLICYSIDVARQLADDADICVTTDDEDIIRTVEAYGLPVPFRRPDYLATDTAGTSDVLVHAWKYYAEQGIAYDNIVLLQPTSPFRKADFIREALALYTPDIDMVVSVKPAACNPYYSCFEENAGGWLQPSKTPERPITRRQDAPEAWEYNGSIYIINPVSLCEKGMANFSKRRKYVMEDKWSVDLDTLLDWKFAEMILQEKLIEIQ